MALPQCLCRHWWYQSAGHWSSGGVTLHTSSTGTWQKPAAFAVPWIFLNTTGADYRSKKTCSFLLESFFRPPGGSRMNHPSAPHLHQERTPNRSFVGRIWNLSRWSVGHKKVDPLQCPRWCKVPHLGKMSYLRRIAELCLSYHSLKRHVLNLPFVLHTAQKTTLEKSGNVWLKGLRVPYGREPKRKVQYTVIYSIGG